MENVASADAEGKALFSQGVNEDDIARIYGQVNLPSVGAAVHAFGQAQVHPRVESAIHVFMHFKTAVLHEIKIRKYQSLSQF